MKLSKISIVIPLFNEKRTILKILKRVEKAKIGQIKKEIIIVDDGSSDGTGQILKKLEGRKNYKIYYHSENKGKGAALKTGFLHTTGEVVIVQDADLEYNPTDYPLLLAPFLKNGADVVYGSRFLTGLPRRIIYFWHQVGNKWLTLLSNIATGLNLSDMETGYKAFRGDLIRKIAPTLKSPRFGFEPEITAKILKKGEKIFEVPIETKPRDYQEGKKIKASLRDSGFNVLTPPKHLDGKNPKNICNKNASGKGVQLELTVPLREQFVSDSGPTDTFYRYAAAVSKALQK